MDDTHPAEPGTHSLLIRVYYEDTDATGLVYHARYLHFLERARTEMLRRIGGTHSRLLSEEGLAFAVRRLAIDFNRSARLDDLLTVETVVTSSTGAQIGLTQRVLRGEDHVAECALTLVCIDRGGRARRIPTSLRAALAGAPSSNQTEGANGKPN
ncbi:MAG TPA: tol-pal system-associated acyl-CoA thioesterase [Alphaproteobacteria bacterium]|nr:tol-pal system-associated acyl-CoA thioesterase [Alphaproteobacteria bacterium]